MPDDQRSRGESRQDAGRAAGSTEHDAVPALARHVRPSTGRVASCRRTTDRGETNRVAGPSVAGVRSGAAASPDALPPGSLAPCGRVDPGLCDACILVAQWGECGEPEALRRHGGFRGERYGLRASLVTHFESAAYVNSDASHSQFRSQFALGLDGTLKDRLRPSASRGPELTSRAWPRLAFVPQR